MAGLFANSVMSDNVFSRNTVYATGGSASASATGGDTVFAWANADAYAYGGALYVSYFNTNTLTLADSEFSGNVAEAVAGTGTVSSVETAPRRPAAQAGGGAVFVVAAYSNTSEAIFTASATRELYIGGNLAIDETGSRYSGAMFGRPIETVDYTGYFPDSGNATLALNPAAGGRITMLDPVEVELYNSGTASTFILDRTGAGDVSWGGKNILDANGGSTISFNAAGGTTEFTHDFTMTTTAHKEYRVGSARDAYREVSGSNDLTVAIGTNQNLAFSAARDKDVALFDFTGASNADTANFTVGTGSTLGLADTDRQLVHVSGEYLVAAGTANAFTAAAALQTGTGVTGFRADDTNVYANASFTSRYNDTVVGLFGQDGAQGLNKYVQDRRFVRYDEDFEAITSNFANAAPFSAADVAASILTTSSSAANAAIANGLVTPFRTWSDSQTASIASPDATATIHVPAAPRGLRFWSGYFGDFRRQDRDGYRPGYRHTQNGGLAGLNYDFGHVASVGVYGGYSHGETEGRGMDSRVKSDSGHGGVMARLAPLRELPGLNIVADAGFTFADNSSRRTVGRHTVKGGFDQDVYTLSAGVFHRFDIGNGFRLMPGASYRYTHLEQDGFDESGLTANRVHDYKADSHVTRLGLEVSRDFAFCGGVLAPAITASWLHEFGDREHALRAEYLSPVPGTFPVYTLRSNSSGRDTAELGFALRARRDFSGGKSLGVNVGYTLGLSGRTTTHSVFAGVEIGF